MKIKLHCICLISISCILFEAPNSFSQSTPSGTEIGTQKILPIEQQIHDYQQKMADDFLEEGIDECDAAVLIAASKEFKKSIIEVSRIYDRIAQSKSGIHLTDAEIDALNVRHFKELGFVECDGKWQYRGQTVNMGEPLPTPESMKPKQPIEGQAIEVFLKTEVVVSELKTLQIRGQTNLPDQTKVMINVSCPEMNYNGGSSAIVSNGCFEAGPFSDSKRPLNRLGDGKYTIEISTPTVNALDASVKSVLGQDGQNMTGKLIKFDEVYGNKMKYSESVEIK